ncbi:hypothetical protein F4823DRAFT_637155 [Ustulina deusta]|nr:hypothetical protein F4823DRAFT_637155 [Ustulina deusta]
MVTTFAVIMILAFAIIYHRSSLGRTSQELPEPPVVRTMVPFFGHIIGMIRYGKNYYQRLRDQCQLPIVTLPLAGLRVYAVFSVPIVQSIQKQTQSFSFEPVQARLSMKLCGASKDAYKILQRDMHQENGVYGAIHRVMHRTLNPGDLLNKMRMVSAQCVRDSVNNIQPGATIKLDEWVRHHVTLATTDAIYGPYNPFREKEVETAFW